MKHLILSFSLIFLFTACIDMDNLIYSKDKTRTTNFKKLTSKLIYGNICENIKNDSTLYVTDFVNQSDFQNKSQLGFVLSDSLKVNVLNYGCGKNVQIKTLNLAKYPTVSENGVKMLTRELKKMKAKQFQDDKQILLGTYTVTPNQLILFLKLVNLEDGNTIATSTSATYITNEILELEGIDTKEPMPNIQAPFHL
jgi:hypothetical protein